VVCDAQEFIGGQTVYDDLTLLVVKQKSVVHETLVVDCQIQREQIVIY
jgi:hypothetical protein